MSASFTSTINYKEPTWKNNVFNKIEEFFNLSGRKVIVFDKEKNLGVLSQSKQSFWKSAGKILAYATVIIPIVMLAGKAIGRAMNNPVTIDHDKGMDWAMNSGNPKTFNKALKAVSLATWKKSDEKLVQFIYDTDNFQAENILSNKCTKLKGSDEGLIVDRFREAIRNDCPKIIKSIWENNEQDLSPRFQKGDKNFDKVLRSIIGSEIVKGMTKMLELYPEKVSNALLFAIQQSKVNMVSELMSKPIPYANPEHLRLAVGTGNYQIVKAILKKEFFESKSVHSFIIDEAIAKAKDMGEKFIAELITEQYTAFKAGQ